MYKTAQKHQADVARLQRLIKADEPLGPRSGRKLSHMTSRRRVGGTEVPQMRGVIDIDLKNKVAWVEPGVTMAELCAATQRVGLVPLVVPEFRAITVGGAVMGGALESSSFRHGMFSDTCDSYELVLADGRCIEASHKSERDLFYGLSGSFGSMATLVSVRVRLRTAPALVRLDYHHTTPSAVVELLRKRAEDPRVEFLDAIVIDATRAVVMSGYGVRAEDLPKEAMVTRLGYPWSKWFSQRAIGGKVSEYLPLEDYLFRYDRGAFWMGQYLTPVFSGLRFLFGHLRRVDAADRLRSLYRRTSPTLNPSLFYRLAFGWKLDSSSLYRILHRLPEELFKKTFVVQDFLVPTDGVELFLSHIREQVKVHPLWLCPVRGTESGQFLSPHYQPASSRQRAFDFIDVGVYGVPQLDGDTETITRSLERRASEVGGRKMLYAINYQTQDEFWKGYDRERYGELRREYGAEGYLMDFYERTHQG